MSDALIRAHSAATSNAAHKGSAHLAAAEARARRQAHARPNIEAADPAQYSQPDILYDVHRGVVLARDATDVLPKRRVPALHQSVEGRSLAKLAPDDEQLVFLLRARIPDHRDLVMYASPISHGKSENGGNVPSGIEHARARPEVAKNALPPTRAVLPLPLDETLRIATQLADALIAQTRVPDECLRHAYLKVTGEVAEWPRRRFAKAAGNHRMGLKSSISGPFFYQQLGWLAAG